MRMILTLLFLVGIQFYGKSQLKPFIKVGYGQAFTDHLRLNEVELGVGLQFNDYISTQINFRGALDRLPQDPPRSFKIATISIEPSYRIFGKKHMFSPVIAYDAGVEIANNGKNKFISDYVYYPIYQESNNQLIIFILFLMTKKIVYSITSIYTLQD